MPVVPAAFYMLHSPACHEDKKEKFKLPVITPGNLNFKNEGILLLICDNDT